MTSFSVNMTRQTAGRRWHRSMTGRYTKACGQGEICIETKKAEALTSAQKKNIQRPSQSGFSIPIIDASREPFNAENAAQTIYIMRSTGSVKTVCSVWNFLFANGPMLMKVKKSSQLPTQCGFSDTRRARSGRGPGRGRKRTGQ